MTKEELLSALSAHVGEPNESGIFPDFGISVRTLDCYVENIASVAPDDLNDDFIAAQIAILKSIGGQLRKEKADFAKSYQPPTPPPLAPSEPEQPAAQPSQSPTPSPTIDDRYEALLKSLTDKVDEMNRRISDRENSEHLSMLSHKVRTALVGKGATDEYVLNAVMRNRQMDISKDVDSLIADYLSDYDKEYAACRGEGAPPRNGTQAAKTTHGADLDAYFAEKFKNE